MDTKISIDERVARAKRLFKEEGYNCCQAVVLAYSDLFGLDDTTAASPVFRFRRRNGTHEGSVWERKWHDNVGWPHLTGM